MLFSNMTLNPQPLHIDRQFCEQETEWGQPLMNSLFTLGLMIGMSVSDLTVGTTIANLGMTEVKFPHPLFEGDTCLLYTSKIETGFGRADLGDSGCDRTRQAGAARDRRLHEGCAGSHRINQIGVHEKRRQGQHGCGDLRLVGRERHHDSRRRARTSRHGVGQRPANQRRRIVKQHQHLSLIHICPARSASTMDG